jgi:DNA-binding transcriptional ArsR family regulator
MPRITKVSGGGGVTTSSPIARVITELETERENLTARLAKVDTAIAAVRELFHLPGESASVKTRTTKAAEAEPRRSTRKGDKTREAILSALARGPMTPGDLAEKLGIERPALRYQVKQLEATGEVVSTGSTGDRRVAMASGRRPKEAP